MIRLLGGLAAAVFAFSAVTFGLLWNARRQLPFNSEGRHFDAETGTVVLEQSVTTYGALAVTCALLALASWALFHRTGKRD